MRKIDQDWAARRLLEYASYQEIVQQIGYTRLVKYWPRWRKGIRSVSRKRGLDFLVQWLPKNTRNCAMNNPAYFYDRVYPLQIEKYQTDLKVLGKYFC